MLPTGLSARLVIGAAFAACFVLLGMGTHKVFSDRKIARMEASYANERATAAAATAAAEAEQRSIGDKRVADVLASLDQANADLARTHAALAAALRTRDGLRQQLTNFTRPRPAGADPAAAGADLQNRIETLGVLLAERDGMAGESEQVADELRDELATCRRYAEAVTKP